jgi:hypothetical protein
MRISNDDSAEQVHFGHDCEMLIYTRNARFGRFHVMPFVPRPPLSGSADANGQKSTSDIVRARALPPSAQRAAFKFESKHTRPIILDLQYQKVSCSCQLFKSRSACCENICVLREGASSFNGERCNAREFKSTLRISFGPPSAFENPFAPTFLRALTQTIALYCAHCCGRDLHVGQCRNACGDAFFPSLSGRK